VNDEEIEDFINDNMLQGYYEISLKTGFNVEQSIVRLAEMVYQFMKTGVKVPIRLKIQRKEEKPLEIDDKRFFENFIITLREIGRQIHKEILNKIANLREISHVTTISKILGEISSYDIKIKKLFEDLPISIEESVKRNLLQDWESKKDELFSKIKKIKTM
ncbi:MAG: hypothetical protein HWN67_06925, partial [Candidatus Helarchaeota archaeon]|nr:hypothetical protein [Candidatus Helarchaeota archaeon]